MTSLLPIADAPNSCEGCGKCCQQIGSPVLVYQTYPQHQGRHPFRPDGLPRELIEEIDTHFKGLFRGQEPAGPCLWYESSTNTCRHYEFRPQVCRDFELGSASCLKVRASIPS